MHAYPPLHLGLFGRAGEVSGGGGGGEVEEGSGGGGDRDAGSPHCVAGIEMAAVDADPGSVARLPGGDGHVDRPLQRWAETPQNGGGVVAEQGAVAHCERGGHGTAVFCFERSHEIHAAE